MVRKRLLGYVPDRHIPHPHITRASQTSSLFIFSPQPKLFHPTTFLFLPSPDKLPPITRHLQHDHNLVSFAFHLRETVQGTELPSYRALEPLQDRQTRGRPLGDTFVVLVYCDSEEYEA